MKSLPNCLTVLRILMIPIIIISFEVSGSASKWVCLSIFIFASLTDYLDGFFARKLKAYSSFGRMLDPIADKLLVMSTLVMLVKYNKADVVPSIMIMCREVMVSGLREHLSDFKVGLPVTRLSKLKTMIQFISIATLIMGDAATGDNLLLSGNILLWCASVITVITGYFYWKEGVARMKP